MPSPLVEMNGAPLLRFWLERGLIDPSPPTQNLGARLGDWLDVRQAIRLHPLLGADVAAPNTRSAPGVDWGQLVSEALGQLRDAIALDRFAPGLWRNPMPVDVAWQPLVWVECWEPYRRYMVDHQKQMTLVLTRLRRQLRAALSDVGGSCRALAQMDAIYDETITPRESRWLACLPDQFGHRLAALMQSSHAHPALEPGAEAATPRPPPPEWLPSFEEEIRQSLLAELNLRAQPVLGLLDTHQAHRP